MRNSIRVVVLLAAPAIAAAAPEAQHASARAAAPAAPAQTAAAPAAAASTGSTASTAAAPAQSYYRIELAPSGNYVTIGAPVVKPASVVFRAYPDGKLMSLRKSDVKKMSQISAQEAAGPANKDLVAIGNLAMQGGSAPAAGGGGGRPAGMPGGMPGGAGGAGGGTILHGPQGAALLPSRDGLAVTTNPATVNQGPAVVNVGDGVAVVSPQPK